MFKKRTSIKQVEEGKYLSPKFNKDGLIPVITTDYKTKEVLMHGFMNKLALKKTIETGEASPVSIVFFNASLFINPCIRTSLVL